MLGGVGRSGSPMAKEMTSTPRSRASAMRRSSDANRYGGSFSMRLAALTALLSWLLRSWQGSIEDVFDGPGLVEVAAGALLHQQVPSQGADGGAVEAGRHDRSGRARPGGERHADAPLPEADREEIGPVDLAELDVRAVGEQLVGLDLGAELGHRRGLDVVHHGDRVRVARDDLVPGPVEELDGALHLGGPHVHPDAGDLATGDGHLDHLHLAAGLHLDAGLRPETGLVEEPADTAQPVARHLGLAAVGVEEAEVEVVVGVGGRHEPDDTVGSDAEVAVAHEPGKLRGDVLDEDEDEVVAEALVLRELQRWPRRTHGDLLDHAASPLLGLRCASRCAAAPGASDVNQVTLGSARNHAIWRRANRRLRALVWSIASCRLRRPSRCARLW